LMTYLTKNRHELNIYAQSGRIYSTPPDDKGKIELHLNIFTSYPQAENPNAHFTHLVLPTLKSSIKNQKSKIYQSILGDNLNAHFVRC
ncbi:MAG: hypothetical protein U9R19_16765, partial [Bacteroidota bacterium]|nr:hypothetical protein [Bacteroidota bacterium]